MTMVIGITGGIATGKSTVSHYLKELGYPIVDADVVARQVVDPGTKGLQIITEAFGSQVLTSDHQLNRAYLAKLVFNSSEQRAKLNQILQPLIRSQIKAAVANYSGDVIFIDVPLLFEQHYQELCDAVMVVSVRPELQLARLMKRNRFTKEAAQARIASQMPMSEKERLADVVIDNNGLVAATQHQVAAWLDQVVRP